MPARFVYSFYGDNFTGSYATRDEAMMAGIEASRKLAEPPQTIYVAQLVAADAKAAGNAPAVLESMRRRALEDLGELGDGYLKTVNSVQQRELDEAVEQAVVAWLQKHHLADRLLRVQGISEHPVPAPARVPQPVEAREISGLGDSEYSADGQQ